MEYPGDFLFYGGAPVWAYVVITIVLQRFLSVFQLSAVLICAPMYVPIRELVVG
jgi:hypothetical protein